MRAVKVSSATACGNVASVRLGIEQHRLSADTRHEVPFRFVNEAPGVHKIGVVEKRPIRLEIIVDALVITERALQIDSEMILRPILQEDAGVRSAFLRGWNVPRLGSGVLG